MLPMLVRLDPTAHKGEYHVISSNSFAFQLRHDSKDALDLLATRSYTRPVFLDLGRQELFLEVEIQSSRQETRISSTRFFYPLDHTPSTRPEFQGGVLVHIRQRRQVW